MEYLTEFINERCVKGGDKKIRTQLFYEKFKEFVKDKGDIKYVTLSNKAVTHEVKTKLSNEIQHLRHSTGMHFMGITLKELLEPTDTRDPYILHVERKKQRNHDYYLRHRDHIREKNDQKGIQRNQLYQEYKTRAQITDHKLYNRRYYGLIRWIYNEDQSINWDETIRQTTEAVEQYMSDHPTQFQPTDLTPTTDQTLNETKLPITVVPARTRNKITKPRASDIKTILSSKPPVPVAPAIIPSQIMNQQISNTETTLLSKPPVPVAPAIIPSQVIDQQISNTKTTLLSKPPVPIAPAIIPSQVINQQMSDTETTLLSKPPVPVAPVIIPSQVINQQMSDTDQTSLSDYVENENQVQQPYSLPTNRCRLKITTQPESKLNIVEPTSSEAKSSDQTNKDEKGDFNYDLLNQIFGTNIDPKIRPPKPIIKDMNNITREEYYAYSKWTIEVWSFLSEKEEDLVSDESNRIDEMYSDQHPDEDTNDIILPLFTS